MQWRIGNECFVCEYEGNRFELGEMGRNHWILKHWTKGKASSDWYTVTSADEGKEKAKELCNGH